MRWWSRLADVGGGVLGVRCGRVIVRRLNMRNFMILIGRRLSVAWIISGVAVFAVGCGASSVGTRDPGGPVSESHAIAYAKAVNLRPSDVQGLVGLTVALRRETKYGPFGTLGERCTGGVDTPGEVFGVLSQRFSRNYERQSSFFLIESVFSAVYLLRSDAIASHEVAVFVSARGVHASSATTTTMRLSQEPNVNPRSLTSKSPRCLCRRDVRRARRPGDRRGAAFLKRRV